MTVVPVDEMLSSVNQLRNTLIIAGLLGTLLMAVLVSFIANRLTKPIQSASRAAEKIAAGELDIVITVEGNDEISQMSRAFQRMTQYLVSIAQAAQQIAAGDLRSSITPQSAKDVLGTAFAEMIENLRNQVGQVSENAANLQTASEQLALAAAQAGQATDQISITIQQVAKGTSQQSESIAQTAQNVDQMSKAITSVARLQRTVPGGRKIRRDHQSNLHGHWAGHQQCPGRGRGITASHPGGPGRGRQSGSHRQRHAFNSREGGRFCR